MAEAKKRGRPMHSRHQDDIRAKIQSSQLVNFLTNHALGKLKDVEQSRVSAALGLLRKTTPDLSATEHSGNVTLTHEQQLEQLK